jgi:DNA repair protein RecO (recombination protein O)
MLVTIDGLVISRREFGETSCFIDVFTKEYGVIEVAAKGVKKLKSPLACATSLFAYCSFCFNKRNLRYTINSATPKLTFHRIANDLQRFALAAYFADAVKFTATPEQDSGNMLRLILIALYELCRDKYTIEKIKTDFETGFARELGFGEIPDGITPEAYLLYNLDLKTFKTLDYFKNLQDTAG